MVQDDTDIGLQPAPSWGLLYLSHVTDNSGVCAGAGAEELDGDARVHFGGRGVPGAACTALKNRVKPRVDRGLTVA